MEGKVVIKKHKVHPEAKLQGYTTKGDAGFDLKVVEDVVTGPRQRVLLRTELKAEIPYGYEMQKRPRSGISLKTPLFIANSPGKTDSNSRGETFTIVFKASGEPNKVEKETRIAQGVVQKVEQVLHVKPNEPFKRMSREGTVQQRDKKINCPDGCYLMKYEFGENYSKSKYSADIKKL